jgi:hypothetical protein
VVIKFTPSEAITDFLLTDITTTNLDPVLGEVLTQVSATEYTMKYEPQNAGVCTVEVLRNTFQDEFGNNNSATTSFNWTNSTTSPNTLYMTWSGGSYKDEKFADITLSNPDLDSNGIAERPYVEDQVWVYDNKQNNPALDDKPLRGASGNNGHWNEGKILDPQYGIPESSKFTEPGYYDRDFPQNFPITLQGSQGQFVYFNTWDRYDDTWDGTVWQFTDKPTTDPSHTVIFKSKTPNGGDQTRGNSWDGDPGRLEVTYALRWWDPQPLVGGYSHDANGTGRGGN